MTGLIFALLISVPSFASVGSYPGEGLYGPEFTFTLDGSVPAEVKNSFIRHLRDHLTINQPDGAKFTEDWDNDETVFRSPNGWWFSVTDNPGVIEIPMKPLTVSDTKRFKADIQDAIFASAAAVGLYPWDYLGGGHVNVDNRIFGGSLLLARNFVVDFWNHSELSMGILNYDIHNAMPLALYRQEYIDKIRYIIGEADAGRLGEGEAAIITFFSQINEVLNIGKSHFSDGQRHKHHDLNFSHHGRVEIRSVRPQANMDVWVNQIELIENRIINHLKPMTKPLELKFKVPPHFPLNFSEGLEGHASTPPVNPQRAIKAFHRYVTESGLDWANHRNYIWPAWQTDELKAFECEKGLEF